MTSPSTTSYFDVRQVGAATVTVISEGTMRWAPRYQAPEAEWRAALPEADADGRLNIGMNLCHIQVGDASIVVDPGFDDPDDPRAFVSPAFTIERTPGMAAALRERGIVPEAVTHVVLTHGHGDHCLGIAIANADGSLRPRFPNARHIIGRADWETAQTRPEWGPVAERLSAVERLGLLETIVDEYALVPAVTLLPTPGETRGHYTLRLESEGERLYMLGDLLHHPCECAHLDWVPPGRDPIAKLASRRRLLAEAAASQALVVMAHRLFPPWGRIVAAGDSFRFVRDDPASAPA